MVRVHSFSLEVDGQNAFMFESGSVKQLTCVCKTALADTASYEWIKVHQGAIYPDPAVGYRRLGLGLIRVLDTGLTRCIDKNPGNGNVEIDELNMRSKSYLLNTADQEKKPAAQNIMTWSPIFRIRSSHTTT